MITYFKLFEGVDIDKPKVGDYVICNEKPLDFLSDLIGKVISINNMHSAAHYQVKFNIDNVPNEYITGFIDYGEKGVRPMLLSEIVYWSENFEDLEILISSKKYNL